MTQLVNPYQYFLDIIAKNRIAIAVSKGIQLDIDIAKGRYENLDISEVVFSNERYDEITDQWEVDIACKARGYVLEGVKYKSGTLAPMISKNAVEAAGELLEITKPGFYSFEEKLYLVADKAMDVSELLAMTGYDITEKHYSVIEHAERDQETHANATVDVNYSFLKGKLYISHLPEVKVEEVVEEQANDQPVVETHDVDQLVEAQLEHEDPKEELPVTEEEIVQQAATVAVLEEQSETEVETQTTVQEEGVVEQPVVETSEEKLAEQPEQKSYPTGKKRR